MTETFIEIMDLIGTVAFAISGSMVAVEQQMDIFGIMILALTTATGGGFIRDLTIGNIPPAVFRNPVYILKFGTHRPGVDSKLIHFYERLLLISDSLGLAAFTVDGVYAGHTMPDTNLFLSVFLGVITGVGGGVLRDLFAGKKPFIFVRHVYALAAVIGAFAAGFLPKYIGSERSMMVGVGLIILIRYLAAHYRWNLPRVQ